MKYLLDSNTCARFLNGRSPAVIQRITSTSLDEIVVCSVVKSELYFGSRRSNNPVKTRAEQDVFLSLFRSLPFDDVAADVAGTIRAELAERSTPIGLYDIMIAATALVNELILVTHNIKEFSRVTGLQLEDWERE
jgi:tRNA(fMet)-specific endonuclease VapC